MFYLSSHRRYCSIVGDYGNRTHSRVQSRIHSRALSLIYVYICIHTDILPLFLWLFFKFNKLKKCDNRIFTKLLFLRLWERKRKISLANSMWSHPVFQLLCSIADVMVSRAFKHLIHHFAGAANISFLIHFFHIVDHDVEKKNKKKCTSRVQK